MYAVSLIWPQDGRLSRQTEREGEQQRAPDPCWPCGVMHWAHECEIQKQRTADGVCILCGDGMHWLRACPVSDPAVHT